jgi:hypothetical protein
MQLFFEIGQFFVTTFLLALVMPIFWIVMFLVFLQYRRQASTEEKLFGRVLNPIGRQMLYSIGFGALGGFAASLVLLFLGLSLEQIGLYFIWPVALLLLLVNPRYLCFSYAGGIVAAAVLIARHLLVPVFPALGENLIMVSLLRVHIPALLVLIALLHLIEAFLIYAGGHRGSSPIYLKQKGGEVVGAFSLQRFWPIPLVALLVSVVAQTEIVGVSMPEWWPIIQSAVQPGEGQGLQYMIIPVAAGLGYADMAMSSTPRERTFFSAKWLAFYSLILLVIALGSEYISWLILPGVIFAPIGHELLIILGRKQEDIKPPRFIMPPSGIRVMAVLPGTDASEAGLLESDIILKVNGGEINSIRDLISGIEESYFMVLIDGIRAGEPFSLIYKKRKHQDDGEKDTFQARLKAHSSYSLLHRSASLGLIPAPAPDSPVYLEIRKPDPLARFRRIKENVMARFGK